jgi:hypothetical protein
MKKIFTLALGLMLTAAIFAADRKPTVTVTSAKRYSIVIDGKKYFGDGNTINISHLRSGRHDVKVYTVSRGFFMRSKKLIASSSFQLKNKDVKISIDRLGQLQISESRFDQDRGWNDRNRNNDHDYGRNRGDRDRRF